MYVYVHYIYVYAPVRRYGLLILAELGGTGTNKTKLICTAGYELNLDQYRKDCSQARDGPEKKV